MSNIKYKYVEFVDHVSKAGLATRKDGKLALVGEADNSLIEEFGLEKDDSGRYCTTFSKIGETDWQLKFVTPCGYGAGNRGGGAIENAFVFERVDEYADFD